MNFNAEEPEAILSRIFHCSADLPDQCCVDLMDLTQDIVTDQIDPQYMMRRTPFLFIFTMCQ